MPLNTPSGSSTSVRVFSVDRDGVEKAITRWAAGIRRTHPEIERIYWFGSWAHGTPTPRSDVDVCIVVSHSSKSYRHRAADYLPELPIPIDLFVYTREEFDRLAEHSPGVYREILRGREL